MRFEEFATARLPALLRYAGVLTGVRELAQDIVQEVLTWAVDRWRRIDTVDERYAYVAKMVTNEYLSLCLRRGADRGAHLRRAGRRGTRVGRAVG